MLELSLDYGDLEVIIVEPLASGRTKTVVGRMKTRFGRIRAEIC